LQLHLNVEQRLDTSRLCKWQIKNEVDIENVHPYGGGTIEMDRNQYCSMQNAAGARVRSHFTVFH
jgi:hypothetical protein